MFGDDYRFKRNVFLVISIALSPATALSQPVDKNKNALSKETALHCPNRAGVFPGPIITDEVTAKSMYLAIARSMRDRGSIPDKIVVLDHGSYWEIGQADNTSVKYYQDKNGQSMEAVTIPPSDPKALQMTIEKCDARVEVSITK